MTTTPERCSECGACPDKISKRRPSLAAWVAIAVSLLSMALTFANLTRQQDLRFIQVQLQAQQQALTEVRSDLRELRSVLLDGGKP